MNDLLKNILTQIQSQYTWDRAEWFLRRKDTKEVWGGADKTPISADLLPFALSVIRIGIVMFFAAIPYLLTYLFWGPITYSILLLLLPVFGALIWIGMLIFDALIKRFVIEN